ncbi:MAG: 2-oxoacid ferredoxin oxidoreductase [Deltaproteobacteria bacterium]|nr:2-oxoacid ferredoxin oxidoreductase [Deltaproteobacteria bacterium]
MKKTDEFDNRVEIQWCPGCPNYGILNALKGALAELGKSPHEICLVSGIGQAAKLPHYLKCNFFNGLHGRAIPVATGINIANPDLTTIVVTGDGDCYGEGGNHFIHAIRRNPDLTVFVHNNEIYALTKGQASPTTPLGEKRRLKMSGVEIPPINMPAFAIMQDCSFVARGFAGDLKHLQDIMVRSIRHRGMSYVDIIQPCITWGTHPVSWYKERVRRIGDDHNPEDKNSALDIALTKDGFIHTGVLYEVPSGNIFASRFRKEVTSRPLTGLEIQSPEKIHELLLKFKPV